jgi:hypothetical protein
MGRVYEGSATNAAALLASVFAAFLISQATAGSLAGSQDPPGLRRCQAAEQTLAPDQRVGCARISGYVAAGGDALARDPIGGRATLFEPSPLLGGEPPREQPVGGSERDPFFLHVSHDSDVAR